VESIGPMLSFVTQSKRARKLKHARTREVFVTLLLKGQAMFMLPSNVNENHVHVHVPGQLSEERPRTMKVHVPDCIYYLVFK